MLTREEALALVEGEVKNKNLRKHMLAAEAVMAALAARLGEDPALWGMAGLLHDLDYDKTAGDPANHTLVAAEMLSGRGFDEEFVDAVKAHAGKAGRASALAKALYAVDPLTGFLVACALIRPQKALAAIDVAFVVNRMGEKRFAAGASREQMRSAVELGLTLEEFVEVGLAAMKGIGAQLEL